MKHKLIVKFVYREGISNYILTMNQRQHFNLEEKFIMKIVQELVALEG